MAFFRGFLDNIKDETQRARLAEVLDFVAAAYPGLVPRFAWNQPMFTDHGTFIIAFSVAAKHIAVAPERAAIEHFEAELKKRGISHSTNLWRQPFDRPFDYDLLRRFIDFNIREKKGTTSFWRP